MDKKVGYALRQAYLVIHKQLFYERLQRETGGKVKL